MGMFRSCETGTPKLEVYHGLKLLGVENIQANANKIGDKYNAA
jgi:hypothetical protein